MNSLEAAFIKHLVQSPQWRIVEELAKEVVNKINEENTIRDSEWETLRATLQKEGKIEGIKLLLSEMFLIGTK